MRNIYSKPLYDLYMRGRNFCTEFKDVADYLATSSDGLEKPKKPETNAYGITLPTLDLDDMFSKKNIRSFENDERLVRIYKALKETHEEWRGEVLKILEELPQISFRMRFDEPTGYSRMSNVPVDYEFTEDMEEFLDNFYSFEDEVDELFKIIGDYEKSIYQPSDFEPEPKPEKKNIVYRLRYDEIQGKLYLNDVEVYKSNLGSKLDKALGDALKTPETAVKTAGTVASALGAIRMPKALKTLAFRASKGSFVVKAEITTDDLEKVRLNKETLDREIQKLSK